VYQEKVAEVSYIRKQQEIMEQEVGTLLSPNDLHIPHTESSKI
jgi:hypothetical protein